MLPNTQCYFTTIPFPITSSTVLMLAIYLTEFSLFSIVDAADSLQLPQQLQLQASLHRWAVPEYRAEIPDFGRIPQPLPFLFFRPLSHYLALQFPFSICLFQSPTLLFLLLFCCIRLTDIYIFCHISHSFCVCLCCLCQKRSLPCLSCFFCQLIFAQACSHSYE